MEEYKAQSNQTCMLAVGKWPVPWYRSHAQVDRIECFFGSALLFSSLIHLTIRFSIPLQHRFSSMDSCSFFMSHFYTSCSFEHSSHRLYLSTLSMFLWKSRWETTLWTSKHILPSQPSPSMLHLPHLTKLSHTFQKITFPNLPLSKHDGPEHTCQTYHS